VPSETVTPDISVGVEAPETTSGVPPLDGVLKAATLSPTVIEYQVLLFHDAA
jgi:hypothetical protein